MFLLVVDEGEELLILMMETKIFFFFFFLTRTADTSLVHSSDENKKTAVFTILTDSVESEINARPGEKFKKKNSPSV